MKLFSWVFSFSLVFFSRFSKTIGLEKAKNVQSNGNEPLDQKQLYPQKMNLCTECGVSFAEKYLLKEHIRLIHSKHHQFSSKEHGQCDVKSEKTL